MNYRVLPSPMTPLPVLFTFGPNLDHACLDYDNLKILSATVRSENSEHMENRKRSFVSVILLHFFETLLELISVEKILSCHVKDECLTWKINMPGPLC